MNYIEELGKFLISTTVFGGLIVWLLKSYFENYLRNDLEKYKYDLELNSFKQKTQFTKLHEESAEVIKRIYVIFNQYSSNISKSLAHIERGDFNSQELSNQIDQILQNGVELENFYIENKILLNGEICLRIEQLNRILFESLKKVMIYKVYKGSSVGSKEELTETLSELNALMKTELPTLKVELEFEFRKILGVST